MPESSEIARQIRHGIFVLITAALVVLFVWCAWRLLLLAFAGLLFGIILRAFLDFVEARTHFGPRLSMLIVTLALCAALGLTVWLIAPRVIAQGGEIASYVPKSLHQAASYFNQFDWGRNIVSLVKRSLGQLNIGSKITSITFNLVDSAVGVIVVFVVGFYGALEPRTYERGLLLLIPTGRRDSAEAVLKEVIHTLRWWVLGQLIPMTVLGAATMISLWVLGVPLAFTLGLLTGVMIFVPYIGALLSEIPAVLIALRQGPATMAYVIILYLVIHGLEGYILTPLVQRRAVRLPPVLTILAQLFMWIVAGFLGVALATPLAAVGLVLVRMLYLNEHIEH
jgi:predicted PurR-regulated permease PerM